MTKLRLSRVLLAAAILLIVAFQSYWINRLYREEWEGLKKETNGIFRDLVYRMQVDRFKNDSLLNKPNTPENLFKLNAVNELRHRNEDLKKNKTWVVKTDSANIPKAISRIFVNNHGNGDSAGGGYGEIHATSISPEIAEMLEKQYQNQAANAKLPPSIDSNMLKRMSQSSGRIMVSFRSKGLDSTVTFEKTISPSSTTIIGKTSPRVIIREPKRTKGVASATAINITTSASPNDKAIIRLITDGKFIDDTLAVSKIDSGYKKELSKAGIPISFTIKKGKDDSLHRKDTITAVQQFTTSPAIVGFFQPHWYQAAFENPTTFLLKKISLQILFSLFLVAFTSVTFIFLYRNLVAQRKLTEMKNDFISNITHELKTPLATVSVAVEALRNFGGIENPQRTKEYLDISAAELQRLSLLVDKVLKLSLFENRELELKKENFDLKQLTQEVLNTMKLQFDTHHARVELEMQGNYFTIHADRLHITSVIFNLLDNALKYSKGKPEITVRLQHHTDTIVLQVEDKGMGIPNDFRSKIFDKFFRVPTGDHHNIKGYGLGLSYVAHVIKQHNGTISVESEPGVGSTFTIKFPVT
jgi:two-component system phosphate regulon sensor histidine kinase PhoR